MIDTAALARWLGARSVTLEGTPSGGGWSNETVFINADGRPLVVRLTPPGRSMFPTYDLGHQVQAMRLAADHGLPVPELVGDEPGADVLGRPFFVMVRVSGRVPSDDDPPFTKAGFVKDAPTGLQRRFHDGAIDAIAAVHAVDPPPFPTVGPKPVDHLTWCSELADWCGNTPDILSVARERLTVSPPTVEAAACSLLWGDARPANMVLDDDFGIVALLDWELAASGPGELDVAWFCEMNRMRSAGMGIDPLPGFPDEADTWQRWAAAVGRAPRHPDWYRIFSAYRVAVLMQLYLAAMVARGRLPSSHRLLQDNPGTRRLEQLLASRPAPRTV
jgi:aminoglycoside phosphotransferase (APT) family kinase protein